MLFTTDPMFRDLYGYPGYGYVRQRPAPRYPAARQMASDSCQCDSCLRQQLLQQQRQRQARQNAHASRVNPAYRQQNHPDEFDIPIRFSEKPAKNKEVQYKTLPAKNVEHIESPNSVKEIKKQKTRNTSDDNSFIPTPKRNIRSEIKNKTSHRSNDITRPGNPGQKRQIDIVGSLGSSIESDLILEELDEPIYEEFDPYQADEEIEICPE